MTVKIQLRRGTAAQWTSANPTLLSGEQGLETDTGKTKIGDGVTAWNSLGYAFVPNSLVTDTGLQFADGSASAPSVSNVGDTNTGLYFPAADTVAISTGGTERVRVNSSGNVGIGTGSPSTRLHVQSADGAVNTYLMQSIGETNLLNLRRANGTNASPTVVSDGDWLGQVEFSGYDGSAYRVAARLRSNVDGAPGSGDMPGALSFSVTADGGTTLTERMNINNAGLITGTGTSLGAWTAYPPTVTGTGWALGNGTITGAYARIGKIVAYRIELTWGSTSTFSATADLGVSVPVTAASGAVGAMHHCILVDFGTNNYVAWARLTDTTYLAPFVIGTNGAQTNVRDTTPFTWAPSDIIRFSGVYEVA